MYVRLPLTADEILSSTLFTAARGVINEESFAAFFVIRGDEFSCLLILTLERINLITQRQKLTYIQNT